MIGRILWLAATIIVAIVLLYISRFWPFDLWSWKGLFGIKSLPPGGNPGQTHERAYALNRRSVWPKNTNWGLIGDAFHKFPTFIARIRRVNSTIFLYKDFMRLPWVATWSHVGCAARRCLS